MKPITKKIKLLILHERAYLGFIKKYSMLNNMHVH